MRPDAVFVLALVAATAAVGAALGLATGGAVRHRSRGVRAASLALVLTASLVPVQMHYGLAYREATSDLERRDLEDGAGAARAGLERFATAARGVALAGLTVGVAAALALPPLGAAVPLAVSLAYYVLAYRPLATLPVPDAHQDNVKNVWLFALALAATAGVAGYLAGRRDGGG